VKRLLQAVSVVLAAISVLLIWRVVRVWQVNAPEFAEPQQIASKPRRRRRSGAYRRPRPWMRSSTGICLKQTAAASWIPPLAVLVVRGSPYRPLQTLC
jgi:hypothetical protein